MTDVLMVEDLAVRFRGESGVVDAVEGVSFRLREGETLAIVGEFELGQERHRPRVDALARRAAELRGARARNLHAPGR